jgi:hypothetical protein
MDKTKAWVDLSEADIRHMLFALIGPDFGDEPESRLAEIRNSRKSLVEYAADLCNVTSNDVLLDLGSGCGFELIGWPNAQGRYTLAIAAPPISVSRRESAQNWGMFLDRL